MRILHLWDTYSTGLFDHAHALCGEAGHESRLLCMDYAGDPALAEPGVRFVRARSLHESPLGLLARGLNRVRRMAAERRFCAMVRAEIEHFAPDVVHLHFGTTAALLIDVAGLLSKGVAVSFYGFDISAGLADPRIERAYRRMMAHRPLVHVLCEEARERAIGLGCAPERAVIANLPLNLDRYPALGMADHALTRWLIPARFVAKKGHAVLLEAFAAYLRTHPAHRLTCWGYGPQEWLRDLADRLGIGASVSVIDSADPRGFDAAYLDQLATHDAVLAPSVRSPNGDDEGGPALTAVLAQAAAKPVIFSDFPGHECSLDDGVEGFVVPQGDAGALTDAMARLAADPARAAAMGRAGRERVLGSFSRDAYRETLLGWYRDLAR